MYTEDPTEAQSPGQGQGAKWTLESESSGFMLQICQLLLTSVSTLPLFASVSSSGQWGEGCKKIKEAVSLVLSKALAMWSVSVGAGSPQGVPGALLLDIIPQYHARPLSDHCPHTDKT